MKKGKNLDDTHYGAIETYWSAMRRRVKQLSCPRTLPSFAGFPRSWTSTIHLTSQDWSSIQDSEFLAVPLFAEVRVLHLLRVPWNQGTKKIHQLGHLADDTEDDSQTLGDKGGWQSAPYYTFQRSTKVTWWYRITSPIHPRKLLGPWVFMSFPAWPGSKSTILFSAMLAFSSWRLISSWASLKELKMSPLKPCNADFQPWKSSSGISTCILKVGVLVVCSRNWLGACEAMCSVDFIGSETSWRLVISGPHSY